MDEKQNQRKKVLIPVLVLGLVLLTIGTTYAFFTYSRQGVEEHVLTTGSLYFVYDELPDAEDSNKISIGNAFPVSDETGMKQDKPGMFEFEVRAKTQGADINYEIYLTKDESSTLPEKVVDTYLTTTGKKGENSAENLVRPSWDNKWTKENGVTQYQFLLNSHVPVLEEGQQGKSLYQEKISDTEGQEYSKIFRYRMWLDESAEGVNTKGEWIYGGKSFTVRVNVYASNEELPAPTPVGVMQSWTYDFESEGSPFPETDFHTMDKMISIRNIRFENKIEIPESVSQDNQWDISEKQDKSVMAYMIPNAGETCMIPPDSIEDEPTYVPCNDLIIASNGKTYGNPDSSFTFAYFSILKTVDFANYNTNLIENMSSMFEDCNQLSELDLSRWETSNVTDMSNMFIRCYELIDLSSISSWETSSVTDMSGVFSGCESLITINVSGWDTSSVTDMPDMFYFCNQLTSVGDLSDWETSSVTDMSHMFDHCSQLTILDLSGWDVSNVTNMADMFYFCEKLTTITGIENWNTSSLTYMSYMFSFCSQLESLDLSNFDFSSIDVSDESNYSSMFSDTTSLTAIYVNETGKEFLLQYKGYIGLTGRENLLQVKE